MPIGYIAEVAARTESCRHNIGVPVGCNAHRPATALNMLAATGG